MPSDDFVLYAFRRLYNPSNQGRGVEGETHRKTLKVSLTFQTQAALRQSVPTGPGQYASPFVELSIRILLSLVGRLSLDKISEELALSVTDRQQAVKNLRELADLVENYRME